MSVSCLPYDITPEAMIEMAKEWNLAEVVIMGFDNEGEFYIGGSKSKLRDIDWVLRHAENWMIEQL